MKILMILTLMMITVSTFANGVSVCIKPSEITYSKKHNIYEIEGVVFLDGKPSNGQTPGKQILENDSPEIPNILMMAIKLDKYFCISDDQLSVRNEPK